MSPKWSGPMDRAPSLLGVKRVIIQCDECGRKRTVRAVPSVCACDGCRRPLLVDVDGRGDVAVRCG